MKWALASALAVSACVTPQQRVGELSSPLLCYIQYAGNVSDKAAAGPELERRGFSCTSEDITSGNMEYERRMAAQASRPIYQPNLYVKPPESRTYMHCETHGNQTDCW